MGDLKLFPGSLPGFRKYWSTALDHLNLGDSDLVPAGLRAGRQGDPFISSGRGYPAPSFSWALDELVDNVVLYSGGRCYNSTSTNATERTTRGGSTAFAIGFILNPAGAALVELLLTQLAATGFGANAAAPIDDTTGVHTVIGKTLTRAIFRASGISLRLHCSLQRDES